MLLVDRRHQTTFAELGLDTFDAVVAYFGGDQLPPKTGVRVRPRSVSASGQPPMAVFYKQYEYRPASWAFLGRRSKARREFANYATMEHLGIPCAERVACGERRDQFGRLQRAFIVTRAIPDTLNLADFFAKHCAGGGTGACLSIRASIRRQLARMTRTSHDGGFFHNDLYWRNVLVSWQPPADPKVWWIDSPRGQLDRWSPFRPRRRLKDLAALDKAASHYCRRSERAAFVAEYLAKPRLDTEVRKLIRAAFTYREQRWPEDWNER